MMGDGPKYDGPTMPGRQNLSDVSRDFLGSHPKSERSKKRKNPFKEKGAEVRYKLFDLTIPTDVQELEELMTDCLKEKKQLLQKDRIVTDTVKVVVSWIEYENKKPKSGQFNPSAEHNDDVDSDDEDPESPAPPTPYDAAFKEHGGSEPAFGSNIEEILNAQVEHEKKQQEKQEETYDPTPDTSDDDNDEKDDG